MQIKKWIINQTLFLFFYIFTLNATEYQPWLGNVYEFELRPSLLYQDYTWLSQGSHLKKYSSNDFFLNISLSNSIPNFGLEGELTAAHTRRQSANIDQLKLTGRFVLQDDVAGDPLSITSGLSFIYAFHRSLTDVSSFHHGRGEGELFISIGKERAQGILWNSRIWGMLGFGFADRGSPWIRLNMAYEKRLGNQHELKLFVHSLWGLGHKKLKLHHFHGYGPIQHQALDLGLRYTYLVKLFGSVSLEYSYRIHAQNFPIYAHRIMAQFIYTFGPDKLIALFL